MKTNLIICALSSALYFITAIFSCAQEKIQEGVKEGINSHSQIIKPPQDQRYVILPNFYSSEFAKYLDASLVGASRGIAGLIIEHPFDCVKTLRQAQIGQNSYSALIKQVYTQEGMRGFYAGISPNSCRVAIKQAYRWPMMLFFPWLYGTLLPSNLIKAAPFANKALTGVTIASLEAFIICPLERLKIWLMTAYKNQKRLRNFFIENKSKMLPELFRGIKASYTRQIITWVSFLVADEKCKDFARQFSGQQQLSFGLLLIVSIVVGLINTLLIMPFDCAKTRLQMYSYVKKNSVFNVMKEVWQQGGIRGLYAGWQSRMLQYTINSAFTVTVFEKLEQLWRL